MRAAKISSYRPAGRPTPLRQSASPRAAGFIPLLWVTLAAAFRYLSGAAGPARHDVLYAALLVAVWGFYFCHDRLLKVRVLGPLLIGAGRLLLLTAVAGFFGLVYWLVWTHS